MIRIERIFCPTDLSVKSGEALRYAVALARAYESSLFLLVDGRFLWPVQRVWQTD